jgi:hypothetical protein
MDCGPHIVDRIRSDLISDYEGRLVAEIVTELCAWIDTTRANRTCAPAGPDVSIH